MSGKMRMIWHKLAILFLKYSPSTPARHTSEQCQAGKRINIVISKNFGRICRYLITENISGTVTDASYFIDISHATPSPHRHPISHARVEQSIIQLYKYMITLIKHPLLLIVVFVISSDDHSNSVYYLS